MTDAVPTTSRRVLVAGNWKMHHTHLEAIQVVRKLCLRLQDSRSLDVLDVSVHPSFIALRSVQTVLESEESRVALGAQNCHSADSGAFTGEVSPGMLAKLNVSYVIIGHSERRQMCSESDEVVRAKAEAVLRHQMIPIACVGETLDERERGEMVQKITGQMSALVKGLRPAFAQRMVFAYEPIWAIGTGRTATAENAEQVCSVIREVIGLEAGSEAAESARILYGGSVKAANAAELVAAPNVDGLLVGGASLDPDEFARVVSEAGTTC